MSKITFGIPLPASSQKTANVPLGVYLLNESQKLHCFFTIENDSRIITIRDTDNRTVAVTYQDNISELQVHPDHPKSIPQLMSDIETQLPSIVCLRDNHKPNIIHLIDRTLLTVPNYVMLRKVSFQESLMLSTLPNALGRQLGGDIASRTVFVTGDLADDCSTIAVINAKGETVRDVLTDSVPLVNYSPLIWDSVYMRNVGKHGQDWVRYFGQNTSPDYSPTSHKRDTPQK